MLRLIGFSFKNTKNQASETEMNIHILIPRIINDDYSPIYLFKLLSISRDI